MAARLSRSSGRLGLAATWLVAAVSMGAVFVFSYVRSDDLGLTLDKVRSRLERVEKEGGPETIAGLVQANLEQVRQRAYGEFASRDQLETLQDSLQAALDEVRLVARDLDKTRASTVEIQATTASTAEQMSRFGLELGALETHLAQLEEELKGLEIPEVPEIDTEALVSTAVELAGEESKRQREALQMEIEATRTAITELRRAIPDGQVLEEQVQARVLGMVREADLVRARQMLSSSLDLTRALGAHLLFGLEPETILAELKPHLAELSSEACPMATQAIFTLLGEHRAPALRALLVEVVLGRLNPRLTPYGMTFLATLDYTGRHAELAAPVLAGTLREAHINNPDRFNAVIDIVRRIFPETQPLTAPPGISPENAASLLRLFRNYLASRVLGYDADSAVFPFDDPAELIARSRHTPRLGSASRERVLALAGLAARLGLARDAARFTLSLVGLTPPQGGEQELLADTLRQLSGSDYGMEWERWRAWADSP
ncbi:MAG: hypothetical protein AB1486_17195 [Planctomycetota bacterium]